jgi:hypothetical protein
MQGIQRAQGTNAFSKDILPGSRGEGKAAQNAVLVLWIVLPLLLPAAFN